MKGRPPTVDIEEAFVPLEDEPSRSWWTRTRGQYIDHYREWRFVCGQMFATTVPKVTLTCRCCRSALYNAYMLCGLLVAMTALCALVAAVVVVLWCVGMLQTVAYASMGSACLAHHRPMDCALNASLALYASADCQVRVNETHFAPADRTSDSRVRTAHHCYKEAFYVRGAVVSAVELGLIMLTMIVAIDLKDPRSALYAWRQRIEVHRARWRSLRD